MQCDQQHSVMKSIASVQYPMELPIGKFCTKEALNDGWGSLCDLGGVVLQHGSTGNAVQYTLVQRQSSGSGMLFDDDKAPLPKGPSQGLGCCQLVCGLVYHRSSTHR